MVTEGGLYIFSLVDSGMVIIVPFLCFCELGAVAYFYGGIRYARDLRYMLNINTPVMCFPVCWYAITPSFFSVLGFFLFQDLYPSFSEYPIRTLIIS